MINEIIGTICYFIMKRADPEWTKQEEEKYKFKEEKQYD